MSRILFVIAAIAVTSGAYGQLQPVEIRSLGNTGSGTLRSALLSNPSNLSRRFVFLDQSFNGGTISLSSGAISEAVNSGVTVEIDASALSQGIIIDAGQASRVFEFTGAGTIVFRNISIRNGQTPSGSATVTSGAGILSEANLEFFDCDFRGNQCGSASAGEPGGNGGAIRSDGSVTLTDCTFADNHAGDGAPGTGSDGTIGGFGGAVAVGGTLTATRCLFSDNSAGTGGGADGSNQAARGGGGGAVFSTGLASFADCDFSGNTAGNGGIASDMGNGGGGGDGGAILFSTGSAFDIEDCYFYLNTAGEGGAGGVNAGNGGNSGAGGAVFATGASGGIDRSTFRQNDNGGAGGPVDRGGQGGDGGALTVLAGGVSPTVAATNVLFFQNASSGNGGAVYCGSGTTVDLIHVSVIGNASNLAGGGLDGDLTGFISFENSIVASNAANNSTTDIHANIGNSGATISPREQNILGTTSGLAGIGSNGGAVPSMLPVVGGPAVNAASANENTPGVDQRGFARAFGSAPDLGATELSFQGDNRIGLRPNPTTHRVNNFYNRNGARQRIVSRVRGNRFAKAFLSAQNDGDVDRLRIRTTNPGRQTRFLLFRTTAPRRNVTGAAKRAGYQTELLNRNQLVRFEARARSTNRRRNLRARVGFQVTATKNPAGQDNSLATFISTSRRR